MKGDNKYISYVQESLSDITFQRTRIIGRSTVVLAELRKLLQVVIILLAVLP